MQPGQFVESAAIGAATGILGMTGPAMVLARTPPDRLPRRLRAPWVRRAALAGMVSEWAINAFATSIPPRTDPGPLGARIVTGAACAALLAHANGQPKATAAVVGGVAAAAGATTATKSRARLAKVIPDLAIAIAETVIAVVLARQSTRV
jgi:uncharacterized membrane protein